MNLLRKMFPDFYDPEPDAAPEVAEAPVATVDAPADVLDLENEDMRSDDTNAIAAILSDLYAKQAALDARVQALESQPAFDVTKVSGYAPPVVPDTPPAVAVAPAAAPVAPAPADPNDPFAAAALGTS